MGGHQACEQFSKINATQVNSYHRQAIDRVGTGLEAVGFAPDGTIDALESKGPRQWVGIATPEGMGPR
jgi:gamma-glutamyl-gamma-aminobutyrate hydrolase PuuD